MAENSSKNENNLSEEEIAAVEWMTRPCDTYRDEYSDCTSIKARFHQYFVFGSVQDCNQWKIDYNNCQRWRDDRDIKAFKNLIDSEEKRREDRLAPHYRNTVWRKRTCPPADWDKPLPAWLEEENKASFLAIKAEESKNGGANVKGERSFCVIS